MKLSAGTIATAAFSVLIMPALLLHAGETAKPLAGATGDASADPSAVSDPANLLPYAPMPEASMMAAMPYSRGPDSFTPRVELFLGYSYLQAVPKLAAGNRLVWLNGGSASIAYNLSRHWGLVADIGDFQNSEVKFTGAYGATVDVNDADGGVFTYLFGPRLSFRHERVTPFVQALFGGARASEISLADCTSSCTLLPDQSTFAMTAGGGVDLRIHHHFAIRLIQAEYFMTRFASYTTGVTGTQNDMRLSTGIVFRFGGGAGASLPALEPLAYSCSVTPPSGFPGDMLAVSGTALNLNPAKTAVYTWSVDGGIVTGVSSTAKIDTLNVAAGTYTLKGHVSEGDKPGENADCTAPYLVKPFEPPTVSCSASPTVVTSGDSSTITAIGVSPQNRPLTYSFSAKSGTISGNGSTATLSTTGAALGPVNVTCNVVDDKGQTATGATSVLVTMLAAAPTPQTSELCSVHFDRDPKRPSRVDNEAKACLDQIAVAMQDRSDTKLALVGNSGSHEKGGKKLAADRAAHTKAYLVTDKGIDSSRIAVYTGVQDGKVVSTTLIPSGAVLDTAGDTPVE